ncbi:hypothetical protein BUALT_Bualt02G0091900 [Buddleja alternifolia]|uniref:Replication protein A n=1 Tax=Buddleja alternifolia TaxID=168488 RepID=A0AAV6Y7B3_9LAMI|nr:hypothetical protein BUALT_Bualt02G0091900 [Buddleja alternifolia]
MYQWIINRTTAIKHVSDDALPRELGIPRFTRFVDILPSEDSNTLVDIIAIVIDKVEQRPVNTKYGMSTVQEFFVINEERMPMMLSLWNDVLFIEGQDLVATPEKMPIVAATRINIADYNGDQGIIRILLNLSKRKKYLKQHVSSSIVPIANAIATITNEVLDCDTINERLNGQQFFAQIRKKEINTRYSIDYRYNVFTLMEAEQASTHSSSHTSSSTSCCIAGSSITINDDVAGSST